MSGSSLPWVFEKVLSKWTDEHPPMRVMIQVLTMADIRVFPSMGDLRWLVGLQEKTRSKIDDLRGPPF